MEGGRGRNNFRARYARDYINPPPPPPQPSTSSYAYDSAVQTAVVSIIISYKALSGLNFARYIHRTVWPRPQPSPIPSFSMLHAELNAPTRAAEKREGAAWPGMRRHVRVVQGPGAGAPAKGDYRARVRRLVRHAHFYCILIAHHDRERTVTQDR